MKARVQKWGNSLAVRIPKSFAENLGWGANSPVEIAPEGDALVIKTDKEQAWDLDELLAGLTAENIHPVWETGPAAAFAEDEDRESETGPQKGKRDR